MRVGIEIGGTFTDLVAVSDDGRIETAKVLSRPTDPARAAMEALDDWPGEVSSVAELMHGSTVATNAVIERKGARTALLVTRGYRDILEIQRHEKFEIFNLHYSKPAPLVPRGSVLEVDERLDAAGAAVMALRLTEDWEAQLAQLVESEQIESLAICLLHSYRDDRHERELADRLARAFPGLHVTLSSEIDPEYREYERASTTVMSAYVRPIVEAYTGRFEQELDDVGFGGSVHVMQSSGGLLPLRATAEHAVRVVLSGPAAGVVGATHMAARAGVRDFITLDMGGTSADVCLVREGRPALRYESSIDGLPVRVPMFDINFVGAGGGSIAWLDHAGLLRVGPESVGSNPGPACYGMGGTVATTTDANLHLGLLRPQHFFGGRILLQSDRAQQAIAQLAGGLGMTTLEAADGVRRIANANMAEALRLITVKRGHDPRDFALLAFGGAGGLHVCDIAEALDVDRALVPANQGVLSALGLVVSDHVVDHVRGLLLPAVDGAGKAFAAALDDLQRSALAQMGEYGLDLDEVVLASSVDLRYVGQSATLNVACALPIEPDGVTALRAKFDCAYAERFGHNFPEHAAELVALRVLCRHPSPPVALPHVAPTGTVGVERGELYRDGRWISAQYVWRDELNADFSASGPVVVEERFATTFVPPGWTVAVDDHGTLMMSRRS